MPSAPPDGILAQRLTEPGAVRGVGLRGQKPFQKAMIAAGAACPSCERSPPCS
jgi:hypothetical protein